MPRYQSASSAGMAAAPAKETATSVQEWPSRKFFRNAKVERNLSNACASVTEGGAPRRRLRWVGHPLVYSFLSRGAGRFSRAVDQGLRNPGKNGGIVAPHRRHAYAQPADDLLFVVSIHRLRRQAPDAPDGVHDLVLQRLRRLACPGAQVDLDARQDMLRLPGGPMLRRLQRSELDQLVVLVADLHSRRQSDSLQRGQPLAADRISVGDAVFIFHDCDNSAVDRRRQSCFAKATQDFIH